MSLARGRLPEPSGGVVQLKAGLVATAFDHDEDARGNRDDVFATGGVEPSPEYARCRGSRWALRIDGDIKVVVLEVAGGQVRIGIDAPASRAVLREELHERVAVANRAAARADGGALPRPVAARASHREEAAS